MAAIPGEPIEYLGKDWEKASAALFENDEGKYYVVRDDGTSVYNQKTGNALFDDADSAWREYHKQEIETALSEGKPVSDDVLKGHAITPAMKETGLYEGQPLYKREGGGASDRTRTPEFKRWFGDWEKAQKYRAITEMKPIVILSNGLTRNEAKDSYRELSFVVNDRDQTKINFVNSTFGKLSGHVEHDLLFRAIPQFEELLRKAEPAYFEEERKGERKGNIVGMHNYVAKAQIDGRDYFIRFSVQEVRKPDGRELHSAFVSDIELTKAESMKGPSSNSTLTTASSTSLIDKLLASFLGNVKTDYDASSKVVDENGEPLVVYHGTSASFDTFSEEEQGSVFKRFGDRKGFFFTSNPGNAGYSAEWAKIYKGGAESIFGFYPCNEIFTEIPLFCIF